MRNSAFDPAVRVALALGGFAGSKGTRPAVASCFGKTQNNVIFQFKIECILAEIVEPVKAFSWSQASGSS